MNTSQVLHASLFICRNENKALGIHCRVWSVAASGTKKQSSSAYPYQCTSRFSIPAIKGNSTPAPGQRRAYAAKNARDFLLAKLETAAGQFAGL